MVISVVNPHDVLFYPSKTFDEAGYDESWLEGNIHAPETTEEDLSTKPIGPGRIPATSST